MDAFKNVAKANGETVRKSIPSQIARLDDILSESFAYTSLSSVEQSFLAIIVQAEHTPCINEQLSNLLSTVRNELVITMNLLLTLNRFIRAHVPPIEDGNNFGVGIQQEVSKLICESAEKIDKAFNALPDYYEKRSAAWEKLASKSENCSKKSTILITSKGGKEGDENKSTVTETVDENHSSSRQIPDAIKVLVSLDLKWYVNLHRDMQLAKDSLLFCADMFELNYSKIIAPKGESDRRGTHFMY